MKTVEPMHDRVLVERLPQPESEGRIIIPEVARKPAILCKVVAVGPGRWEDGEFVKTAVKPGDTVLVPHSDRWLGDKLADWKQGECVLITAGDIGAIVG
jgi:co-chaperonin GroES (HSP10)